MDNYFEMSNPEELKKFELLSEMAKDLEAEDAVTLLRLIMNRTGDVGYAYHFMGEDNVLFSIVAANADADCDVHEKMDDIVNETFRDDFTDLDNGKWEDINQLYFAINTLLIVERRRAYVY